MNFAHVLDDLIVGSCLQTPGDLDRCGWRRPCLTGTCPLSTAIAIVHARVSPKCNMRRRLRKIIAFAGWSSPKGLVQSCACSKVPPLLFCHVVMGVIEPGRAPGGGGGGGGMENCTDQVVIHLHARKLFILNRALCAHTITSTSNSWHPLVKIHVGIRWYDQAIIPQIRTWSISIWIYSPSWPVLLSGVTCSTSAKTSGMPSNWQETIAHCHCPRPPMLQIKQSDVDTEQIEFERSSN